jgi:hypothetical protein
MMNIEIPEELLFPTVEELESRTARDMADKWKPCKRPGKKERNSIKQEKETAKLRAIASEYDSSKQPGFGFAQPTVLANSLSSLFIKSERPKFSLAAANASSGNAANVRPTIRASFEKANENGVVTSLIASTPQNMSRKRGRPPKLNAL